MAASCIRSHSVRLRSLGKPKAGIGALLCCVALWCGACRSSNNARLSAQLPAAIGSRVLSCRAADRPEFVIQSPNYGVVRELAAEIGADYRPGDTLAMIGGLGGGGPVVTLQRQLRDLQYQLDLAASELGATAKRLRAGYATQADIDELRDRKAYLTEAVRLQRRLIDERYQKAHERPVICKRPLRVKALSVKQGEFIPFGDGGPYPVLTAVELMTDTLHVEFPAEVVRSPMDSLCGDIQLHRYNSRKLACEVVSTQVLKPNTVLLTVLSHDTTAALIPGEPLLVRVNYACKRALKVDIDDLLFTTTMPVLLTDTGRIEVNIISLSDTFAIVCP